MEVLIVVDMQNDFITGSLGTPEAEIILPKVVKRVEAANLLNEFVIYTQDTHGYNYFDTQEGELLPVKHCQYMTEGWKIPAELDELPHEFIMKETFGSEHLANVLKQHERELNEEIDRIELCGLCTDICVVTNALLLKTAFPEVEIVVRAELCAGVTPEKHNAALEVMKSCQINVI